MDPTSKSITVVNDGTCSPSKMQQEASPRKRGASPPPDGLLVTSVRGGKPDRYQLFRPSKEMIPPMKLGIGLLIDQTKSDRPKYGGVYPPKTWKEHEDEGNWVPWKYDTHAVLFDKLKQLESKARKFEKVCDSVIDCWLEDKENHFDWNLGQDRSSLYSTCDGHVVPFPRLFPQTEKEMRGIDDNEKMKILRRRMSFLSAFFVQCDLDLVRIWEGDHNGQSCRYFQMDGGPTFKVHDGWPWYLGDGRSYPTRFPQPEPCLPVHSSECHFCTAERELFYLEKELVRLLVFKERLTNRFRAPLGSCRPGTRPVWKPEWDHPHQRQYHSIYRPEVNDRGLPLPKKRKAVGKGEVPLEKKEPREMTGTVVESPTGGC